MSNLEKNENCKICRYSKKIISVTKNGRNIVKINSCGYSLETNMLRGCKASQCAGFPSEEKQVAAKRHKTYKELNYQISKNIKAEKRARKAKYDNK